MSALRTFALSITVTSLGFLAPLRADDPKPTAEAPEAAKPEAEAEAERTAGIAWASGFEAARERSTEVGLPLLVDFGAEWCGWCKKLDRETFGDLKVIEVVKEHFIAVKVDCDAQPDVQRKYGVTGLPTIVFLSPGGDELHRVTGFRAPEVFLEDLRKPASSSKTLQKLKEEHEKNPDDIAALRAYARAVHALGNTEEASRLLSLALEKDPTNPALLLDVAEALGSAAKLDEARAAYEKLLDLPEGTGGDEKKAALLPLGRLLVQVRDYESAAKTFGAYLTAHPPAEGEGADNSVIWEAHFWRGYCHAVRKEPELALADLRTVREKDQGGWGLRANYIIDIVESAE